jgi:hypothetical protein
MAEQDELLDALLPSIVQLKNISQAMRTELELHHKYFSLLFSSPPPFPSPLCPLLPVPYSILVANFYLSLLGKLDTEVDKANGKLNQTNNKTTKLLRQL